jgi:hypothetical protein
MVTKPVVKTLDEHRQLYEAAKKAGVLVMVEVCTVHAITCYYCSCLNCCLTSWQDMPVCSTLLHTCNCRTHSYVCHMCTQLNVVAFVQGHCSCN